MTTTEGDQYNGIEVSTNTPGGMVFNDFSEMYFVFKILYQKSALSWDVAFLENSVTI